MILFKIHENINNNYKNKIVLLIKSTWLFEPLCLISTTVGTAVNQSAKLIGNNTQLNTKNKLS